ncbi:nitrogenase component 1 [Clostridium sp. YIM B02555]|uniref:nitrogenase component 1 n=1 Tax=Clostridium sp. YIM B02555 TaxID=2911968 RepID=UPI001EED1935|nr:nitrogenase component 1 [Clostridium sp. YIM B02555]
MSKILDQPRYKCALGGIQTIHAITRTIPILHSGPGCAAKVSENIGGSGYFSPHIFPCTDLSEKEVVFGGEKKLQSTIENALQVIDADLFIVITGCTPEIVGDDAGEISKKFAEIGKPVIFASTPGFKGNNYRGHEWVIEAIIEQYLKPADKIEKGLVNIWAGVPQHDPFWLGNLRALEKLVAKLGLKPNTIFGNKRGLENINKITSAEFNLLVSPWVDLDNVKLLESKFGTPFLHYPVLPIGAVESGKFLRKVGEFAKIDKERIENIIKEEEDDYYYYIERFADVLLETRSMSKRFAVVSDSQYSIALTKFFVNDLGLIPTKQYITDDAPEKYRDSIKAEFEELNDNIKAEVAFETDGYVIRDEIKKEDFFGIPFIVGSSWENRLAKELDGHYLNISWPIKERLIVNSTYVGYEGALKLIEDIYSIVLKRFN